MWPRIALAALATSAIACTTPASRLCKGSNYALCDVRDPFCQTRLYRAVQCDRGESAGGLPEVRVLAQADGGLPASEQLREELALEVADLPPAPHRDAALQLLEVLPPGVGEVEARLALEVERTVARYSTATESITVVDRGVGRIDRPEEVARFVESLLLAIEDRRYDVPSAYAGAASTGARLARDAVVHGDALFHRLVYESNLRLISGRAAPWQATFDELSGAILGDVATHPARATVATMRVPAWLGARALSVRWVERPNAEAVDRFWMERGDDTEPLFASPFGDEVPPLPLDVRCPAPNPPAGLVLAHDDELGPVLALAFLARSAAVAPEAWALAHEVRGDRIVIFGAADATALQWRIRARDPAAAARMLALAAPWAETAGRAAVAQADELVLAATTDPALLPTWPDATRPCD